MFYWCLAVVLLNSFDGAMTWFAVRSSLFSEANPLMEALLHRSDISFLICKLVIINSAAVLIYLAGHNSKIARGGLILVALVYAIIFSIHTSIIYQTIF
jgi:hypothetical protein